MKYRDGFVVVVKDDQEFRGQSEGDNRKSCSQDHHIRQALKICILLSVLHAALD